MSLPNSRDTRLYGFQCKRRDRLWEAHAYSGTVCWTQKTYIINIYSIYVCVCNERSSSSTIKLPDVKAQIYHQFHLPRQHRDSLRSQPPQHISYRVMSELRVFQDYITIRQNDIFHPVHTNTRPRRHVCVCVGMLYRGARTPAYRQQFSMFN